MARGRIILVMVSALLIAAGCGAAADPSASRAPQPNAAGYYDLTADGLAEMMDGGTAFALVNVHIPYEGEIAGTDTHIRYDAIANHLDQLPGKDEAIVLYCRSGAMSTAAAKTLVEVGYTNVWELNGGMVAWAAAGYGVVQH